MPGAALGDDELRPVVQVDAVVRGNELTLDLCEELERLAPFGLGNPGVTLLAPACELSELGRGRRRQAPAAGGDRRRRALRRDRLRAGCVARPTSVLPVRRDVVFRLGANRWNGTVSPQLVVRRIFDTPGALRGASDEARFARNGGRERRVEPRGADDLRRARACSRAAGSKRQLVESETFRALWLEAVRRELERAA